MTHDLFLYLIYRCKTVGFYVLLWLFICCSTLPLFYDILSCLSLINSWGKLYCKCLTIVYICCRSRRGCRGRDGIVVGFTITYAISASCEFESHSWRGVLDTTLCDQVCQWLAAGQWFSSGTLVSSTNKTDHHDITEILLKVALNTTTLIL